MKRVTLILVGIFVCLMGILGLVPGLTLGSEPGWHAVLKILVGLVAIFIGAKRDTTTD